MRAGGPEMGMGGGAFLWFGLFVASRQRRRGHRRGLPLWGVGAFLRFGLFGASRQRRQELTRADGFAARGGSLTDEMPSGALARACGHAFLSVPTDRPLGPSARLTGHTGSGPASRARHASPLSAQAQLSPGSRIRARGAPHVGAPPSVTGTEWSGGAPGLRVPRLRGGCESVLGNGAMNGLPARASCSMVRVLATRQRLAPRLRAPATGQQVPWTYTTRLEQGKRFITPLPRTLAPLRATVEHGVQARRQTTPYPYQLEGHQRAARRERVCASPAKAVLEPRGVTRDGPAKRGRNPYAPSAGPKARAVYRWVPTETHARRRAPARRRASHRLGNRFGTANRRHA